MRKISIVAVAAALLAYPAAAQVSDDVVRIGVLDDMSSIYSDLTGEGDVIAAKMAIADFGGKALGKPIDLVIADHQSKADIASAIARKWFDEDKVDMVVGLGNSAVALATQGLAKERGKLDIVVGAGSSDLTGKACSPTGFHWLYDTYAMAKTIGLAVVRSGGDTWFFLAADYAFGEAMMRDTTKFVEAAGGKILGQVRAPINTPDFSSFLLQAQASKAKIIGLANAGPDTINSIKQSAEFGVAKGGQRLAGLLVFITDVHSMGLQAAQGLYLAEGFYWDTDDATRAWSKRFLEQRKMMPNSIHAGTYGAVTHYLKAVQAAGTDDGKIVAAKMKELPIEDFFTKGGKAREDGRVLRDMHLFQVKAPAESKGEWDAFKFVQTVPGAEAFRPLAESECPLVKK